MALDAAELQANADLLQSLTTIDPALQWESGLSPPPNLLASLMMRTGTMPAGDGQAVGSSPSGASTPAQPQPGIPSGAAGLPMMAGLGAWAPPQLQAHRRETLHLPVAAPNATAQ